MATVVLLDAHALIHRAYHALPPLTSSKGEMVNAVYGVAALLLKVIRELKPTHLGACFDLPGPTFRHKEFKEYKAHRPQAPEELARQIAMVKKMFKAFGIPSYEEPGFEADDLLGTIVEKLTAPAGRHPERSEGSSGKQRDSSAALRPQNDGAVRIIIVTGDLDTLQLVDDNVSVYTLRRSLQDTTVYDPAAVKERYGLVPSQMTDFKGLKGDPSDNIPGVPGIGEKTATVLLQEFGSIGTLYERIEGKSKVKSQKSKVQVKSQNYRMPAVLTDALIEKLLAHKDQAFFSKYLATIRKDASIKVTLDALVWSDGDPSRIAAFFTEMGFKILLARLAGGEKNQRPREAQADLFSARRSQQNIEQEIERLFKAGVFSEEIYELELKVVPVIQTMQKNGILIDTDALKKVGKEIEAELKKSEKKIFTLTGEEFNVLSSQQLSKILFEKLSIPTQGLRKTPGGVISTQASELTKISELHPIIPLVEYYRELAKLKSTYVDALPVLVDPKDTRLHTTYKQLGAETGRLASENPNLQNIPIRSDFGRKIRSAFIAAPGCVLLSADYSQIELRVAAVLSEDETLLEAFKRGEDIHTTTASQVFGVSEKNVTPDMRRQAKVINFGVLYGMGSQGLAEAADISRAEAKEFIEKYFRSFPGITKYVQETKRKAHELGFVETMFGRRRYVVGLDSRDARIRAATERAAVNAPVQGSAADIMKMAMVAIAEKFPPEAPDIRLLLQVHDELVFEVKKTLVKTVAPEVRKIMEGVVDSTNSPQVKFPIPLVVDIKVGKNWEEMEPL